MTPEQWDIHWHRIREDALADGHAPFSAAAIADHETEEQFGPRPQGDRP